MVLLRRARKKVPASQRTGYAPEGCREFTKGGLVKGGLAIYVLF